MSTDSDLQLAHELEKLAKDEYEEKNNGVRTIYARDFQEKMTVLKALNNYVYQSGNAVNLTMGISNRDTEDPVAFFFVKNV